MQASDFYTTDNSRAIQINIISAKDSSNIKQNNKVQSILTTLNFNGETGEVAPIFDEQGVLCEVYIGVSQNSDDYLAAAALQLPAGKYIINSNIPENILLSWSNAQYKFLKYKSTNAKARVLVVGKDIYNSVISKARACFIVRDLINIPAADLGPAEMSEFVANLAKTYGAKFSETVGEELLSKNYPAIYTVGQGSSSESRLLELNWGDAKHPRVSLVGKGVCFDSGGLDIKPSAGMRIMKKDMGGAANVIGLADWIMSNKLPINLQVLIPAVENSVDGNAYRPGDVIKMRSGLTVEIDNTDAEGRLVLADAITQACEDNPDLLIDFATLTGAARIAVGTDLAAMFCNNDLIANELAVKSEQTNDPIWRLPLFDRYNELLNSQVANLVNSTKSEYAGAITAALFLQNFVTKNVPWVHFDIMAWNLSSKPGKPEGGEAMAIFAVGEYLRSKYK